MSKQHNTTKDRNGAPSAERAASLKPPQAAQTNNPPSKPQVHLSGWRKYFKPHTVALIFNECTTDEDRRKLEKDIEKHGLQQPIVTASVPNEDKVYVIDGISRLDAMEALGWQIVNSKGEWVARLRSFPKVVPR
jgi:hypothetical protein